MTASPPRRRSAGVRRLLRAFALAVPLAAATSAHALGQRPAWAAAEGWPELFARDARLGFTARSAAQAEGIAAEPATPPGQRAAALFALGAGGGLASLARLESWAVEGSEAERQGAILGLGELGARSTRLASETEALLERLVDDPSERIAGCAVFALVRARARGFAPRAEELAGGGPHDVRSEAARSALAWTRTPGAVPPSAALRRFLELRWEAARSWGTVDGQAWTVALVGELARDEAFLDAFVLLAAAELRRPGVEDHLLELLLQRRDPLRLRACVRRMPAEVERLVESGLWSPQGPEEWRALVEEAIAQRTVGLMPKTFAEAARVPGVAVLAASQLVTRDRAYLEPILAALASQDPGLRVAACEAIGSARLEEQQAALWALREDPDPELRTAALVARLSLEDKRAPETVLEAFAAPDHPDRGRIFRALVRAYREHLVITVLDRLLPRLEPVERAVAEACLFLRGRPIDRASMRAVFGAVEPGSFEEHLLVRALGLYAAGDDLEFLARRFPLEDRPATNLEMALVLVRGAHHAARPLLHEALWRPPWNRSVLAAAVVHERSGVRVLQDWIDSPPPAASSEDIRRVGFAVGEWGGFEALDRLVRKHGARGDHPALQGALLGALAARTR